MIGALSMNAVKKILPSETIKRFIVIPDSFTDSEYEVTVRPVRSKHPLSDALYGILPETSVPAEEVILDSKRAKYE